MQYWDDTSSPISILQLQMYLLSKKYEGTTVSETL